MGDATQRTQVLHMDVCEQYSSLTGQRQSVARCGRVRVAKVHGAEETREGQDVQGEG